MATKSQEILLKGNTTNASAVPSSLKVREIAINALDRSLFTNDGNSIVKLYTGTTKWFDVNGNANNALKLGGVLASEYINKEAFNSHINNSIIHITAAERTAWNNKWDYNEETIKAVKVNAATSADYATNATNADTLDGYHHSDFVHTRSAIAGTDLNTTDISNKFIHDYVWTNAPESVIGSVIDLTYSKDWRFQIFCRPGVQSNIYARSRHDGTTWTDWHKLAFTTDNVASATKLQTARKIWGRPFDGTGDVNGDLTEVDNITASGNATIQGDIVCGGEVVAITGEGTPAGVTDYSALTGKPSINGVTLVSGNNTLASLGIQAAGDYATNSGVTTLLADYAKKTFVANNYAGKAAFNSHTADTDIHITAAERVAWNAKWDYNEATIKAVKVTSASSADQLTSDAGTSAIPIYFDGGIPVQCTPSDLFSVFDNAYSSSTGEHSLGITIAGHTRMVVVAYSQTAGSVAWSGITGKPTTFTPSAHTHTASEVSGLPTSLKNPYALTFGSKTYDGSAAATISASDLGALTAHQTIYALTLKVNGTSQGVYNPASATKTINIAVPTKTSQITNDSGFITSAAIPTALKNPYAVEIKANGVSLGTYDGSKAATFNLSAANVGAASKIHTHTASEISGLPTKLSAFTNDVGYITGITKSMVEGVLTGNITSHTHSYLPLSGGTIEAYNASPLTIKVSAASNLLTFITDNNTERTVVGYYASSTRGSEFRNTTSGSYIGITDKGTPHYNGNTLLHAGNYNSYTPTLTGTGASGTWGINISGNAATATNATNADKLDGLHASSFARMQYDNNLVYHGNEFNFTPTAYKGEIFINYRTMGGLNGAITGYIFADGAGNTLAVISNGQFSGNSASATKLQTPCTIWGQSFDGSANVSGDLSMGRSEIYWNGDTEGSYISSNGTTDMIYNMRNGHIFQVGGDRILIIKRYDTYKLQVNGKTHIAGDLVVDGEVSALVA